MSLEMISVLRDPAKLILCPPIRLRANGLDDAAMSIVCEGLPQGTSLSEALLIMDETVVLSSLLKNIIEKECWQEYICVDTMFFEWAFDGNLIHSCNPFFELLMRCLRKLIISYNKLTERGCIPDMNQMDQLASDINLAIKGLAKGENNLCITVFQPSLYSPPILRPEHETMFTKRGVEVAPYVSVSAIQTIFYMISAETWMYFLENTTRQMVRYPSQRKDLFQQSKQFSNVIQKVYREVFSNGSFSTNEEYKNFIKKRYDPGESFSDFCRIILLAKGFTLDIQEIIMDKKMLKSVAHTYVDDIYSELRKIIKLNPFVWNRSRNQSTCIKMFESAESNQHFATPYYVTCDDNVIIEATQIRTLEHGNIPLSVECYIQDTCNTLNIEEEEEENVHASCFPCIANKIQIIQ